MVSERELICGIHLLAIPVQSLGVSIKSIFLLKSAV